MDTSRLLLRSGQALAAAALPAALAGPAAAVSGISVGTTGTTGSTVSVVTGAGSRINGGWGTAALLTGRRASFAQGRRVALAGTTVSQSAAWSQVRPGTTVAVMRSSGATAGTRSVTVSSPAAPTTSSTSRPAPSRGVMGGIGGAARDYGPLTLGIGAALVGSGVIAAGRVLRRRSKPYRL
ncbi:hypothetical protein ACIHEJ_04705 [Streptomyces sp. NPDC052301]|uniref:hypothetical protein n=1 Tax=Streptomyces sp. NPDC052301 TaxID=3365687 RepID=UPI0037D25C4F